MLSKIQRAARYYFSFLGAAPNLNRTLISRALRTRGRGSTALYNEGWTVAL